MLIDDDVLLDAGTGIGDLGLAEAQLGRTSGDERKALLAKLERAQRDRLPARRAAGGN